MCFRYEAEPAIPKIAGASVDSEDLILQSKDGTNFSAFGARSDDPSGVGVVVLPDVRGLFHFYEELALRFAEVGHNSVAFDYFGRTAGVSKRDAEFPFMEHIPQTTGETISEDVGKSIEWLRSPEGGTCKSIFTVGFCFGGSNSWLQAANGHGLAGCIGFYGMPGQGLNGAPGPAQRANEMQAPILALMGGDDPHIPEENIEQLRSALQGAEVTHEVVVYENAPHSFFDRSYTEHAQASEDAWRRCLDFIKTNAS